MRDDNGRGKDLPQIIAENIAELRKSHGMTQAGLAEQLGYSDKSVSKWERGDGVPDVLCLKRIADLFGVPLDYFVEEEHKAVSARSAADISAADVSATDPEAEIPADAAENIIPKPAYVTNRKAVAWLSVAGVWLLACAVFIIVKLCGPTFYLPFVIALPVTAILLIIFQSLWGKRKRLGSFVTVTALVWAILFMVCYICRAYDLWLLMVLGFPATVVVGLACGVKKKVKPEEQPHTQSGEI